MELIGFVSSILLASACRFQIPKFVQSFDFDLLKCFHSFLVWTKVGRLNNIYHFYLQSLNELDNSMDIT